jgi:hypothetical protein
MIGPWRIISPGTARYVIVLNSATKKDNPTATGRMARPPTR